MMRGKNMYAMAVRNPQKEIEIVKKDLNPISNKYKILKLPILRGIVSFVDSMVMGMKIITMSAEMAGLDLEDEDGEPSKFEIYLTNKLGSKLNDYLIYFSVFLAIVMSIGLFMLLPVWIGSFFNVLLKESTWALGIVEGLVRIAIFLLYIFIISRSKDIHRVFQYHGAEHKTINCYEHKEKLTVENVKKYLQGCINVVVQVFY